MMLIDTHAHITYDPLFSQIDDVLKRAQAAQISHIMNICTDRQTLERGLELAKRYPWIHQVAATTPHDVETQGEDFDFFAQHARDKKLIAIGETGLDYHYEHSPKKLQQAFLIRYMELAIECHLPLVIHCREAFEDLFKIADHHYKVQGVMQKLLLHCFTGSLDDAKEALDRGWMISLSGIVTFKKSQGLKEVAAFVPKDHLVVETDAPYLAPQSKRGSVNEPSFVVETLEHIAMLKNMSKEALAEATTSNALKFFNLK